MDVAARDAELIENGKPSLEISLGEVIDFSGIGSKSYAEEVTLTQLTDDKLERYRRMVPGYDWESLAGGVDSLGVVRLGARTVFSLSWTAVAAKLKSVAGDRKFKVRSYHGQLHNAVPDCLMLCLAYRMACLRDGPESAGAQNVAEQLLRGFWILPDEVEKIVEVAAQIKETGNLDVGGGAKATLGAIEIGGEVDAGLYTSSTTTVTPSPSAAETSSSGGGTA